MRKLKTSDIPAACRCLKQIGLKDQIREIAQNSDTAKDAWSRGFDMIWNVFDRATEQDGEKYIYEFLAGPFEMTAEEVADLDLPTLFGLVKQLAEDNDLAGFFNFARKMMK